MVKLRDLIILEEMHSSTDFVSHFFILCKDRQMPTVSALENTEDAIRPVHPTAPRPVVYSAPSRCVGAAQTVLKQEVLDKQDNICEAVLAINNTLKGINTSIQEICDVIKHKK